MPNADPINSGSRRAMALILTVLVITILLVTAAQLATLSSTRALVVERRTNSLQHQLAVDSTIELVANLLARDKVLPQKLDRDKQVEVPLQLGQCKICVTVQDDGAKFNVLPFTDERSAPLLRRKLQDLERQMRLPKAEIDPRPVLISKATGQAPDGRQLLPASYLTFDQLFKGIPAPAVFRWDPPEHHSPKAPVWSDYVSLFGDGRLDLKRADPRLAELAVRDLQAGWSPSNSKATTLDETVGGLDATVRPAVAARLGYGLDRYALTIQTAVGTDVRRWYVVATMKQGAAKVLHRQQITW